MARMTSISLADHLAGFVAAQVEAGRFETASEVVQAGLRLLQEHEAKTAELEAALIEGEQSGVPEPFNGEAFLRKIHAKHGR